jgi:hypothetical protein
MGSTVSYAPKMEVNGSSEMSENFFHTIMHLIPLDCRRYITTLNITSSSMVAGSSQASKPKSEMLSPSYKASEC